MTIQAHEAAYFCHGMPGSEHDALLLQNVDESINLIAPNLLHSNSADLMSDALEDFDKETAGFADGNINVVGFSIGAMVAIKVAAARPDRIGRLTLISPAAPLTLGDFLPNMAGKPVFSLARKHPILLQVLTSVQGLVASMAPGFLVKQLFAKCGEAEKKLLADPAFLDAIRQGLANSYRRHPDAYVSFIRSYVEDWSTTLNSVTCPVELWHGDRDTWAPIAMSHKLSETIAGPSHVNVIQGTEHYSTLAEVSLVPLSPTGQST